MCAYILRAVGRGPRWQTSTARMDVHFHTMVTGPGTRYRCPRTASAWRSARWATRKVPLAATYVCTPRAVGRGPSWAPTSTARPGATTPGRRYRCLQTAPAWRSALTKTIAMVVTAMTPVTCACIPRAAGRGPRWGQTSTVGLRTTTPGTQYRCPQTARAWRSALLRPAQTPSTAPAMCGCTRRATGRGPRWGATSTARLRATSSGPRYLSPQTARAWR